MLNLRSRRSLVLGTTLSLFIAIALPSVSFAGQGRGRGHERRSEGRDDRRFEQRDDKRFGRPDDRREDNFKRDKKKSVKFINGHDARDGRWDGRGPRRNRSFDSWDRDGDRNRNTFSNRVRSQFDKRYFDSGLQRRDDGYYLNNGSNAGIGGVLGAILNSVLKSQ